MSYYPDPELSEDAIIYKIVYCSSLACTRPTSKCEHSEISNNIVRFFIKRNTTKSNNTYSPSTVTFVMARWKRKSVSTYSFFHLHKARCSVALSERTPSIRPSQGRGGAITCDIRRLRYNTSGPPEFSSQESDSPHLTLHSSPRMGPSLHPHSLTTTAQLVEYPLSTTTQLVEYPPKPPTRRSVLSPLRPTVD